MKTLLIDADGLVITRPKYFSEIYSEKYGVPLKDVTEFFVKDFRICQTGKADLKEQLKPYLPKWKWQKSVDDFLEYWFTTDVLLNQRMLDIIDVLRKKGYRCYLASDQEKYRAAYISDRLKNHFDGLFFSCDLGYKKSEQEFFEEILKRIQTKPEDIEFWDDEIENTQVAVNLGIKTKLYIDPETFEKNFSA